jgi:hypothetical protein
MSRKSQSYKSTEEIRAIVKNGERFAERLFEEFADHTVESAVRMSAANEYLDGLSANKTSKPSPQMLRAVVSERELAIAELEVSKVVANLFQAETPKPETYVSPPLPNAEIPKLLGSVALSGTLQFGI